MSPLRTPTGGAVALAGFVTVLWSSSWVLIRWGLDGAGLPPITFAALRYAMAAIVLAAWVLSRRDLRTEAVRLDRGTWVRVIVLGVLFYAVTQGAQFVAIDAQPAATTSLVLSWTPLVVGLASARSISEGVAPRQLVGSVVVIGGAAWYFVGDLGATLVGMTAAIVSLLANVTSTLLGRAVNRDGLVSPVVVTAVSMGIGALVLVAVGMTVEGSPVLSGRAWVIIAWLAIVNTALAFTLWNVALRTLSAVEAAAINNTMLVQIALLGWVFLDEPLGLQEIAGIALVTLGILFVQTLTVPLRRRSDR